MNRKMTLVSHPLCPYVQRAAIVMMEKDLEFDRVTIDLGNKPDWFLRVAPLAKTPVLLVGNCALFESAVICEYLEEIGGPPLHPRDALRRAQERGWSELGSAILDNIAGFYCAADGEQLADRAARLRAQFQALDASLGDGPFVDGPYFGGARFSMADATFATVFRYFDVFDTIGDFGILNQLPRLQRWRDRLAQRDSVRRAVGPDYPALLLDFLRRRNSELSRRMETVS